MQIAREPGVLVHRARRERRRDRQARRSRRSRAATRAALPRTRSPAPRRSRPRRPAARSASPRSPTRRCSSCTSPARRRSRRSSRAHARGQTVYARDLPAVPRVHDDDLARRASRARSTSARRRCATRQPASRSGTGCRPRDLHIFGSDHCSFNFAGQKELGPDDFTLIPNGAPGAEERAPVLWTHGVREGRITPRTASSPCSRPTRPRSHGMAGRKGVLAPGADADIVVWDPELHDHRDAGQPARQRRLHALRGMTFIGGAGGGVRARRARLPRRRGARASPARGRFVHALVRASPRRGRRSADGGVDAAARGRGPARAAPAHRRRGRRPAGRLDGHLDHGARLAARRARRDRRRHRRHATRPATLWATLPGDAERFVIVGGAPRLGARRRLARRHAERVAGLEVLRALARRAARRSRSSWSTGPTRRARASAAACSARAPCAGSLDPDDVRGLTDRDGVALPDALAAHGVELDRMRRVALAARGRARLPRAAHRAGAGARAARPAARRRARHVRRRSATASLHRARTRTRARRRWTCAATRSSPRRAARSPSATTRRRATTCARRPAPCASRPGSSPRSTARCELSLDQRALDPGVLAEMLATRARRLPRGSRPRRAARSRGSGSGRSSRSRSTTG